MKDAPDTSLTVARSDKRNLHDPVARRILHAHGDAADGVQAGAVLRRQPHHDGEIAVAAVFIQIARRLAADRGLDHRIDVARRQAVARRPVAVDVDLAPWAGPAN